MMFKIKMIILLSVISFLGCVHTTEEIQPTPSHRENYIQALRFQLREDYDQAENTLKEIIEKNVLFYPAYSSLVEVYAAREKWDEAISYFKNIDHTANPLPAWAMGQIYEEMKEYEMAIASYKDSVRIDDTFYGSYEGLVDSVLLPAETDNKKSEELLDYFNYSAKLRQDNSIPQYGMAYYLFKQEEYDKALSECKKGLIANPRDGYLNYLSGEIYNITFNGESALVHYGISLEWYTAIGDKNREQEILYKMAMAYEAVSQYSKALEHYEKVLAITRETGDRNGEGMIWGHIGAMHLKFSEYREALKNYRKSLSIAYEVDNRSYIGSVLNDIGLINEHLSNYPEALEYYKKALVMAREDGNKNLEGSALNNIGGAYLEMSDYPKALEYQKKALAIAREINFIYGEGVALINIGVIYYRLSNYLQSLKYSEEALVIFRKVGDKRAEGAAIGNMGGAYHKLKEYGKALEYYENLLAISQEIGDKNGEKAVLLNLGNIYRDMSDNTKALAYQKEALAIALEIGDRSNTASAYNNISSILLNRKEYSLALEYSHKAMLIFEEINDKESESASIAGMGNCYFAQKEYEKAFSNYQKAVHIVESIRGGYKNEVFKTGFFQKHSELYSNAIACLYELHTQNPDKGFDLLAFRYMEKSKARGLLDLLIESHADINQGVDPGLREQERMREKEYAGKNTALQKALSYPPERIDEEEVAVLKEDLNRITKQIEDLKIEIIGKNPKYAGLKYPEPVTITEIQKNIVKESTLLLGYKVTREAIFVWRISKRDFRFFKIAVREAELTQKVLALRNCFEVIEDKDIIIPRAVELYKILLAPVLNNTDDIKKLTIIPDGILNYLPFEVLIEENVDPEQPFENIPFIIKNYAINYSQSATIAYNLTENSSAERSDTLFAMGDPVFFDNEYISDEGYISSTLSDNKRGALKRLIHSGEEILNISRLFDQPSIFLREEATEERLKQHDLEKYRYLHFATHGLLNEENPQYSGVILTQDDDPAEDGFLLFREIFNLKLKADLVVLSACNTGLGKNVEGEGIVGLTRAWLYAGASSLVVTLWNIDDHSTSVLMEAFYRKIQEKPNYSQFLRAAKLELIKDGRYAHPYYWAGFVLIGGYHEE